MVTMMHDQTAGKRIRLHVRLRNDDVCLRTQLGSTGEREQGNGLWIAIGALEVHVANGAGNTQNVLHTTVYDTTARHLRISNEWKGELLSADSRRGS